MTFNNFYSNLLIKGLEWFGLYYSTYDGIVSSNEDPEKRGRLKISCPAIYGQSVPDKWVHPKGMFSGKKIGFYAIPQKGDTIYISFKNGNPKYPIWEYGWWLKDQGPEGVDEKVYAIITPLGYRIEVNENDKEIKIIRGEGQEIVFSEKLEINYNDVNFKDITVQFISDLISGMTTSPGGAGVWNPQTIAKFETYKVQIEKMFK